MDHLTAVMLAEGVEDADSDEQYVEVAWQRIEDPVAIAEIERLIEEIVAFTDPHVYTPAEIAAYKAMKRFAETGVRTVRRLH